MSSYVLCPDLPNFVQELLGIVVNNKKYHELGIVWWNWIIFSNFKAKIFIIFGQSWSKTATASPLKEIKKYGVIKGEAAVGVY